jgi:hypothetical protein
VLALEPEQRLPYRLAAHRITHGEVLLSHIISRRQPTAQDIRTQVLVDIVAEKHRKVPSDVANVAVVKYHVKPQRLEIGVV